LMTASPTASNIKSWLSWTEPAAKNPHANKTRKSTLNGFFRPARGWGI